MGIRRILVVGMAAALAACATAAPEDGFQLVYLGRDAIFIEAATVVREGPAVSFRALRVQDSQFKAGDTAFLGGFSRSRIDCAARTYQMLSFQSLRPDYSTGPDSPIRRSEAFAIAGGSAEEAMAKAVCDGRPAFKVRAGSVEQAVAVGRKRLDELE